MSKYDLALLLYLMPLNKIAHKQNLFYIFHLLLQFTFAIAFVHLLSMTSDYFSIYNLHHFFEYMIGEFVASDFLVVFTTQDIIKWLLGFLK